MADTVGLGQTFSTIALWEASGPTDDAECYFGANLGIMLCNAGGGLTIYAADGHEFQGIDGDVTTIAGVQEAAAGSIVWDMFSSSMVIRGIMIDNQDPQNGAYRGLWARARITVDKCLFKQGGTSSASVAAGLQYNGDKDFINNVILIESGSHIAFYCTGTTAATHRIKHNTVITLGTSNFGLNNDNNSTPTYEVENNYFGGFATADYRNPGIFDTFNKCASEDSSGSEAGLQSLTPSDMFVDPSSDWTPKSVQLIDGGVDLSAESDLATDPAGNARGADDGWDIGAIELTAAVSEEAAVAVRNIWTIPKMGLGMGIN